MNVERVPLRIFADSKQASAAVAGRIAELICENNARNKPTVLGLATGHTPIATYKELIRLHKEGLDFSRVVTFNLDEYWPIKPTALQSYNRWMHENLFAHLNINPENIHIPRGDISEAEVETFCRKYEEKIAASGGIDFQILGIGRSGHIGFNEPGSSLNSKTRLIRLDKITRKDAASDFFGEENVPEMAITMGVGTILNAREIGLLSFGEQKASIVRKAVEGQVVSHIAASFLQEHSKAVFYLDAASAAELTRIKTPWLIGPCGWDQEDTLKLQGVVWLTQKLKKSINKLTAEDYAENGLADLLSTADSVEKLNRSIFRQFMDTITMFPAGKDGCRRIVVFSPHPDDDVICMGGTLRRLVQQGHEVHVAYMVSGCLSVFDHDVVRYADFVTEFNSLSGLSVKASVESKGDIKKLLCDKVVGDVDAPEIQNIKSLIRKSEAVNAAVFCGVDESRIHFLNMPFYNTGKVQKLSIGPDDVMAVRKVLDIVKPELIFAAGDMSDPHGTHSLCNEAGLAALEQYAESGDNQRPVLWLYRGAWQEWASEQVEMVIPLSPEEVKQKRYAIFRHQSQKDRAMFPGPYDNREFWQRAEDRNQTTAAIYNSLGLPEYYALEAFAKYPLHLPVHVKKALEANP